MRGLRARGAAPVHHVGVEGGGRACVHLQVARVPRAGREDVGGGGGGGADWLYMHPGRGGGGGGRPVTHALYDVQELGDAVGQLAVLALHGLDGVHSRAHVADVL